MSHQILIAGIKGERAKALAIAARVQINAELRGGNTTAQLNANSEVTLFERVTDVLELATLDLLPDRLNEDVERMKLMRQCAGDAFRLLRLLPNPDTPLEAAKHNLRAACLAVLGDMGADAARWLRSQNWEQLPYDSKNWREQTWAGILDTWLRLIRKRGWDDRDAVLTRVLGLRAAQNNFERNYLISLNPVRAKSEALELIGLYHLAKAAEILALFITEGVVEGDHQVQQLLDSQFDRAIAVGESTRLMEFEPTARLLAATASQLVDNSIWTVTRAVNTRVTNFVEELVAKGRGDKALFDVLPPQRRALAEQGLLGSSRRAVVVSLPTSSGKTLIAQFRILQALNQFDSQRGWVAYLAPTRTLVNQITRRLRRDFAPLNIIVEQVSPALEVDNVESALLRERNKDQEFKILVTTPEKLDLLLRQGCEAEIGRPLTLVVVDEAHNIKDPSRGMKLELLLATINRECKDAQFLLLTPFINNAREIARWLGGNSSDDISFGVDWQPNDRIIGIVQPQQGALTNKRSHDYSMRFESVHTTRKTLAIDDALSFSKAEQIAKTFSKIKNPASVAAVSAQHLKQRGPVIVMHARPDWVWSLAHKLKTVENRNATVSESVLIVQDYLRLELGDSFPLIELLEYGIGVHHAGLPGDVRALMEWLFEESQLQFLIATTTIAQGVNFPVSGVVMASHQYPDGRSMKDMPPEDFWNIAGRAGRVTHGQPGVVVLAADTDEKAKKLRLFINEQTGELNSALIQLVVKTSQFKFPDTQETGVSNLGRMVYYEPLWSSFLQYLAHTYTQMGKPATYTLQVEQVLRSTLGFEKLRSKHAPLANAFLSGIRTYCDEMREPGQPLKLVDSTGFSLQGIKTVLSHKGDINEKSWNAETLFADGNRTLQDMMGVLLKVPELRENLEAVTGGKTPDGDKLALIVKDWVNGESIGNIASKYFQKKGDTSIEALTRCGQNLFGNLAQTASWGLGALLAITASDLPEEQFKQLSNLPSRVFYGVDNDQAIILRLLGIPRTAANHMAETMPDIFNQPLPKIRTHLAKLTPENWQGALGKHAQTYRRVWRILEGLD